MSERVYRLRRAVGYIERTRREFSEERIWEEMRQRVGGDIFRDIEPDKPVTILMTRSKDSGHERIAGVIYFDLRCVVTVGG